jgi:signal transduction histidine kinase
LGNRSFILSHSQFKRILLTGQLSLLTFTVCLGYLLFDLTNGIYYAWPYQAICSVLSLTSFIANRKSYHTEAKVILGLTVNFTIFIFASSEPAYTGLYTIYIPICLGALAAFGLEERKWAAFFISLSLVLCAISLFGDLQFLPDINENPEYISFNFTANLFTSTSASVLILYFLISVNNRAELMLLENERQLVKKNEELTKLNAELDRFVYSSSHDLRAPLTSVLGLIQLTDLSNDPDEMKSYTRLMRNRIEDLDKFIREISDYSRNTRLEIHSAEVNIKKIVREVLESLRFFPGSEQVEVKLDIGEELTLTSDPTRIKMVLSNLVSNSFKYRDPRKNDSYILIQSRNDSSNTILEIADNGIGIPEETLPRVFEMFFQAHEQSVGSGLGLYIVKETVEKLGGTIEAESASGKGSTFRIYLPRANSLPKD